MSIKSTSKKPLNWTNILFFSINTIVSIVGATLFIIFSHVHTATWVLSLVLWVLYGMAGITIGYHRLFSHQTFKAVAPVRFFLLLFGAGAFEGSVLEWSTDHRNHHRYSDTDRDPYSITKGFWHAHIGWLFTLEPEKRNYDNVKDLQSSMMCRLQHKFILPLSIFMGYVLPALIVCLWGSFFEGAIIAALRITMLSQFTFCINSVCHYFGKKTYSEKQTACDNWFAAWLTFGEGYHNFHHQFPLDYRNAIRFYQFDPSKWVIFSLKSMGLASDLNRVSTSKRLKYKVQFDWGQVSAMKDQAAELMKPIYDKVNAQLQYIESMEKSVKRLKADSMLLLNEKLWQYQELIAEEKKKLSNAHMELKYLLRSWNHIVKNSLTFQRKAMV